MISPVKVCDLGAAKLPTARHRVIAKPPPIFFVDFCIRTRLSYALESLFAAFQLVSAREPRFLTSLRESLLRMPPHHMNTIGIVPGPNPTEQPRHGQFDPGQRRRRRRYRVRFLQRIPLGTRYPDVVERVRQVARNKALAGRCTLVVDATGVGARVLDMLRRANLGCPIEAVILTGGERESHAGLVWHVPKRDLVTGLRAMMDNCELGASWRVGSARVLAKKVAEMSTKVNGRGEESFGARREGEHDDLVMATALACWRARCKGQGMWGTKRLV
jgi:hypothetical protein